MTHAKNTGRFLLYFPTLRGGRAHQLEFHCVYKKLHYSKILFKNHGLGSKVRTLNSFKQEKSSGLRGSAGLLATGEKLRPSEKTKTSILDLDSEYIGAQLGILISDILTHNAFG